MTGTGKGDPGYTTTGNQLPTDGGAIAGQQLNHTTSKASVQHQLHCPAGNQAGLFCRFGNDGIAGNQCRSDLPKKNGQREVPRADADKNAPPGQLQLIGLAGRAWQMPRSRECFPSHPGVVTTKVHRLTHLVNGVLNRFACLAMAQGNQLCLVLLELIGQVFQTLRPMGNRCCVPLGKGRSGNINGLSH